MSYKTAYGEVVRAYERDRATAQANADARRDALYVRLPRVREIDARVSAIGLSLARYALAGDRSALNAVKAEIEALNKEKKELLKEHLIPENFLEINYKCELCKDTGFIETESNYSERCACLRQRLIEKYYDLSNLKRNLKDENFDNFVLDYYGVNVDEREGISPNANMQRIYRVAVQFVEQFNKKFSNLLLYGEAGLGKTFMCNCIAKDLLDMGFTVLYVTAPRLFKVMEDARFRRDEMDEPDEMLDAVTEVDLLIIDDLGAEFSTVITSSALFDILNQRLLEKKATVISTNLSPSELSELYSDRIVSRLWGHYDMFKFFGEDIRVKKKFRRTAKV